MDKELLKRLPKMDDLLNIEAVQNEIEKGRRTLVVEALRETIDFYRNGILSGDITALPYTRDIAEGALKRLSKFDKMLLHPVINATGILLHTNLGRSRLSEKACKAVVDIGSSYSNLEYNEETGGRGTRYSNVVDLLTKLTGAEDAVAVNNNAGAIMLILSALAKDKRVIVSRGEQVEIGGQFRMPDIMEASGCHMIEVGTTNKTHLSDYEREIQEDTVLLKVHTSNYRLIGFTQEVELSELCVLGKKHGLPVIYDLGSGSLINLENYGINGEPYVNKSVADGADVICFSGDKLLGGPQAGIIIGKKEYIEKIKKNPLTRALRIDKMTLAALEATLREYLDEKEAVKNIPLLSQLLLDKDELKKKAERLHMRLIDCEFIKAEVREEYGQIGGGSMPGYNLKSFAVAIAPYSISVNALEQRLRKCSTPIVARIAKDRLLIDVLTIEEKDFDYIAQCIKNSVVI